MEEEGEEGESAAAILDGRCLLVGSSTMVVFNRALSVERRDNLVIRSDRNFEV